MKIGVLVSGNLGFICLKKIQQQYPISFVLTDKGSTSIIEFCEENKLIYFAGNPRGGKASAQLQSPTCDVILSINYLFIVEKDVIGLASKMAINFHGSLLPKYRGRTPHVWAIINNETETGITAHLIDENCDTGDVLQQVKIKIESTDTGAMVLQKFNSIYPDLVFDVLKSIENNTIKITPQNNSLATYFGKRTPDDGAINWLWQRERIRNWVRAQAKPYPGAFAFIGAKKIVIHEIEFSDFGFNQADENGKILAIENNSPIVKTENGCIKLTTFETDFILNINDIFE
ncbi:MAG: hypothetical protein RJA07_2029 [Bacteroidota bacterium]|jgi:methionyl-tRNA formyltransferase